MIYEQLRSTLQEYALRIREFALEADLTSSLPLAYIQDKSFLSLWQLGVPEEYGYRGLRSKNGDTYFGKKCLELTVWIEEIAYGDPAMTLALPGPQLMAPIVLELGLEEQKTRFFTSFMGDSPLWTAFNLTEAGVGSDVSGMQTLATPESASSYRLFGEKKYVANGERAQWSCTFAKVGRVDNPYAIQSFLIHESEYGAQEEVVLNISSTLGMRAARLGHTQYKGLEVRREQLLGLNKSPLNRGLHGAMKVFFFLRPCTSSMAIGLCRAMLDYAREHLQLDSTQTIRIDKLQWKLDKVRHLVYRAAWEVDQGVFKSRTSSMGKWMANSIVYEISRSIAYIAGADMYLDHPILEKWLRDARMIEFMEGSTNIHKREVGQDILQIR